MTSDTSASDPIIAGGKWRARSVSVLLLAGLLMSGVTAPAAVPPFVAGVETLPERTNSFAGRVLITELSCTACHGAGASLVPRRGPDLSQVGARVRPEHLHRFIADPAGTKPGTTMPALLEHLPAPDRDQAARALAAYLSSIATNPPVIEPVLVEAVSRGRKLYHSVGCVACHSPEKELAGSVPLGPLAEKYSHASLTSFLRDPLAVRPAGRMPDLKLDPHEAADIAAYLLREQNAPAPTTAPQPDLAARGRELFATHRCGSCHTVDGLLAKPSSTPLDALRADRAEEGCLSGRHGDWPVYPLSADQRTAIHSALRERQKPSDIGEEIRLTLARFNCVACHDRDGHGGVPEVRDEYFTTRDPNLGEQGRLPPALTGVGARLQPAWLRKALVQGARSRPYSDTRMPAFGDGEVTRLLEWLPAIDRLPAPPPVTFENENDFKRIGRELAGTDGLGCVVCHTYKDQLTGAMGALDLTLMAQRVTRDWFHHYLAEPQRFSPSTLMPAFWPGGESAKPDVLGGDRDRQIEALWRYLSDGYSTDAPKGVHREPLRLVASGDEAVMLRRSYPGIGKRGIGVGYPSGINLVFSAEQLCLAMLWPGEFADPAGVWTSQGHGTARPLGRARIEFAHAPELAQLERIETPWPAAEGRPQDLHFEGYRLDRLRRPTFRYQVGKTTVEDAFVDQMNSDGVALSRTITFRSADAGDLLVFRVATATAIEPVAANRFKVGPLEIVIAGDTVVTQIKAGDLYELRVPVQSVNGKAVLALEYRWPLSTP